MTDYLRAFKVYRQMDEGYLLDGYLVAKFIDGYQIGTNLICLSEALSLNQRLRKIDRMLRCASAVTLRFPEHPLFPEALGGLLLPQRSEHVSQLASLYSKMAKRIQTMDEKHFAHLVELRSACLATQMAIQRAEEPDGYR